MKIEVLLDVKTTLGEGPLWDVEEQRLYWVDSFDGRVFRCTDDGRELRSWDVPQKIGSMCLRKNGGAIVSLQRGLHFLDFKTGEVELIHDPEPEHPQNRLNDGKVDRFGRFFVGSMDTSEDQASGALYRLDPDLTVHRIDSNIVCSNGPCWSPDNQKFYFADTWSGEISVYDFDPKAGNASNRRSFTSFKGRDGAPDGATVDAEGYVWSALVYGGKLLRFGPDGSLDREIDMPVKKVTSVMFGGPNLDILFVTSMAKQPLPRFPGDGVLRGSLFKLSQASRQQLEAWLAGNKLGDKRLRAGLPADWRIGDKTGTGENGARGDVAIVRPPNRPPILVVVYTHGSGVSDEKLNDAFAAVGRVVADGF